MSSRKTSFITAEEDDLVHCLQIVDPLLQFLTRATSNPFITLQCLQSTVAGIAQTAILTLIPELARRGILHLSKKDTNTTIVTTATAYDDADDDVTSDAKLCPLDYYDWFSSTDPENITIGFPPPLTESSSSSSSSEDDLDENKKQKQKQKRSKASRQNKGLSGSTKLAAKRRMAALRRSLKKHPFTLHSANCGSLVVSTNNNDATNHQLQESIMMEGSLSNGTKGPLCTAEDKDHQLQQNHALEQLSSLIQAEKIPKTLLDIHDNDDTTTVLSNSSWIIPQQAAYAGFHQKRHLRTKSLTPTTLKLIPPSLLKAFSLCCDNENDTDKQHQRQKYQQSGKDRQLYCHQVDAIETAFSGIPTIVCTSTGSGKSLCYLLPVLTCAMTTSSTSLLIFPTKALAQDQFTKIQKIIQHDNHHYKDLSDKIQVATIDGDMTCHATRSRVAEQCNVILTNPDTLHASILPNWKKNRAYCKLLANIRYIVVDEAHIYEGTFGAHVSLIFARLIRLCHAASLTLSTSTHEPSSSAPPTFLASSATIEHPEIHFRLLCRIPDQTIVKVLFPSDDGSPCSSRYFFTWNPPLLDSNGIFSKNKIVSSSINYHGDGTKIRNKPATKPTKKSRMNQLWDETGITTFSINDAEFAAQNAFWRRRHAADETARLLAIAVASGVRCIAFAKTRCLVEWIYDKCIYLLKQDDSTLHLVSRIDSYRGGYTADVRRRIEEQLFQNKLMGVVGTSALELGVDVGGVDLTLHCGYPGSYTSLMQQAGRAGRGGSSRPSFSISVCFNSPSEQYLWKNPKALLGRSDATSAISSSFAVSNFDARNTPVNVTCVVQDHSIPLDVTSIVQDHLLCAALEFPLVGSHTVAYLLSYQHVSMGKKWKEEGFNMTDHFLFGLAEIYEMGVKRLCEKGALLKNSKIPGVLVDVDMYSAHSSIVKPWANVSIRSIEPLQYTIIDISHPLQGGKMDGIHSDKAVLDVVPYSRIFYHCFPGSIIMHRGKKYQVLSLTQPPSVNGKDTCNRVTSNLFVFAKRSKLAYLTRALQTTLITIVKRFESVEVRNQDTSGCDQAPKYQNNGSSNNTPSNMVEEDFLFETKGPIAGNGVITLKRTVWGYAKLSPVNRNEIARVELSLPSIEFDTNAFWVCTEASVLKGVCSNYDAGVHALSHAILAVTPMFIACSASDIDCDHSYKECTRMLIFDSRAGGGTHVSNKVWKNLDRILPAAISLLEYCATCCSSSPANDSSYDSGCPACVQGVACVNFQDGLSRRAGLTIAKRMWRRLKNSSLLMDCVGDNSKEILRQEQSTNTDVETILTSDVCGDKFLCLGRKDDEKMTPRKKLRARALESAKDLDNARKRQIVVGRPSWPLDGK